MDIIRSRQFGELVRDARLRLGMTQADLAGAVGPAPDSNPPKYLGATQISRIEAGVKEVERWQIDRLVEVLGLDHLDVLEATTGIGLDVLRELLDARIKSVAAGNSGHAKRQATRRNRHRRAGGTPPAATVLNLAALAGAILGQSADPQVTALDGGRWAA